jgi:hypothetical protein
MDNRVLADETRGFLDSHCVDNCFDSVNDGGWKVSCDGIDCEVFEIGAKTLSLIRHARLLSRALVLRELGRYSRSVRMASRRRANDGRCWRRRWVEGKGRHLRVGIWSLDIESIWGIGVLRWDY